MQNCVSLRSPIFDFGSGGPSKIKKHPIFDVFEGFSPITLVFLNRFTSKMAQNACINKLHVTSRPTIFLWCQGTVKFEKHTIFGVFKGFYDNNTGVSQLIYFKNGAKCVY